MANPRFYSTNGPISLRKLADISGAEIGKGADPEAEFVDVRALFEAGPEHVSFLDNKRYIDTFSQTKAGACIVHPDCADKAPKGLALLLSEQPYHAYAKVAQAFYPAPPPIDFRAPTAVIDKTASIGENCQIEAGAVIGARAEIGDNCHIGPLSVIGAGVVVGNDCIIEASVTVIHAIIADRVTIHAGVRIGQDGFGFAPGSDGHLKVPQIGCVYIEDDVSIGANTTIDRGSAADTVIGEGTKIDNLVQIGHNVKIGKHCIVVSQVGISGSTEIGDFVMIGGKVGIAGHLKIGSGARIAAMSGVMNHVEANATIGGAPAMPMREWLRSVAVFRRLAAKKNDG